ncbi:hypothetical protein FHS81_001976 [Pseudochelatococcus contaminans]|uniref:Putative membrane protein insertion efficiency factor n=2 Tax=Pseudochelatococcus contaminans TaxID=1538103 RepID=A0A7W5Z484_9HYPH|nr:hypothetical protein [Pseudochelatococcus contaminans]
MSKLHLFKTMIISAVRRPGVFIARTLIRIYQLTLSSIFGRHCRHLPSCSFYTDEAIDRYGFWAGGWVGLARVCRCHPLGTSGLDLVPDALPATARWYKPWTYGRWRGTNAPPATRPCMVCEDVDKDGGDTSKPGLTSVR